MLRNDTENLLRNHPNTNFVQIPSIFSKKYYNLIKCL